MLWKFYSVARTYKQKIYMNRIIFLFVIIQPAIRIIYLSRAINFKSTKKAIELNSKWMKTNWVVAQFWWWILLYLISHARYIGNASYVGACRIFDSVLILMNGTRKIHNCVWNTILLCSVWQWDEQIVVTIKRPCNELF